MSLWQSSYLSLSWDIMIFSHNMHLLYPFWKQPILYENKAVFYLIHFLQSRRLEKDSSQGSSISLDSAMSPCLSRGMFMDLCHYSKKSFFDSLEISFWGVLKLSGFLEILGNCFFNTHRVIVIIKSCTNCIAFLFIKPLF